MFGLSFGKLVVLLIALSAVWYAFRLVGRLGRGRRADTARDAIAEMQACPACGTYILAAAARDCGRDRCPY